MTDWSETTLDHVILLKRGFDLPNRDRTPGIFPIISAGGIVGYHDVGPVEGPGFAVGRATNLGIPTWSESAYWPLNTTLYAADFFGNDPRYLYRLFQTLDLSGYDSGSVQPMLNRNYIAKVKVLIAPRNEQRAIAEVLGALDDKIAANTKLARTALDLSASIIASDPATIALSEIVDYHKASVRPEDIHADVVDHYSLPAFDEARMPEQSDPRTIKSSKFRIQQPSVLVSKLNPRFPRVWDVPVPRGHALASTEFLVLESRYCPTGVLAAILSQPSFSSDLQSKAAGTSGSHQRVRPADLLDTMVIDPRDISPEVSALIDALYARVHAARSESQTLAELRDTLLPPLMSGRLRVKDAEKTVGDVV